MTAPDLGGTPDVERLLRVVTALADRGMRQHLVVDHLRRVDDGTALTLIEAFWRRAVARDPASQELLLDLSANRPLEDALGYERVRALYEQAHRGGLTAVARILLGHPATPPGVRNPDRENEKLASESLGRRKALARGRNRQTLDRLLFDRNPAVVRHLLQNPRVTERDVVCMAAMRPAWPPTLVEIHRHPRWIGSYRVKKALVMNPGTPGDVAVSLLVHLLRQDLTEVARGDRMHPAVRSAALELLTAREGTEPAALLDPPVPPPAPRLDPERLQRALTLAQRRRRLEPGFIDLSEALSGADADGPPPTERTAGALPDSDRPTASKRARRSPRT